LVANSPGIHRKVHLSCFFFSPSSSYGVRFLCYYGLSKPPVKSKRTFFPARLPVFFSQCLSDVWVLKFPIKFRFEKHPLPQVPLLLRKKALLFLQIQRPIWKLFLKASFTIPPMFFRILWKDYSQHLTGKFPCWSIQSSGTLR